MSKRIKYLEVLRDEKPLNRNEYTEWLEKRCHALSRLRLLDMSDATNNAVMLQDRYRARTKKTVAEYEATIDELQIRLDELQAQQVRRTSRSRSGYVYLLKVEGYRSLYKIGRTRKPKDRIKTFAVKLPFPVEYDHVIKTGDMYALEKALHNHFSEKRKRNSEFFTLSGSDLEFIRSVSSLEDIPIKRPFDK